MRNYALPLLNGVPEKNERHEELLDLIDAFQYFEPIDTSLVARESLLREFIGGGNFHAH
jgi:uridine kinase